MTASQKQTTSENKTQTSLLNTERSSIINIHQSNNLDMANQVASSYEAVINKIEA